MAAATTGQPAPALAAASCGSQSSVTQHTALPAAASIAQPPSLFFAHPACTGGTARWAHASASQGHLMWVYGGVGASVLDSLDVLDTELMVWRSLSPSAPRARDRPDKLHAAAMCAIGNTLWLFGGQQGRKHLRSLFALNTDMLSWRLVSPGGAVPVGREGHSLTAVGQLAYLFGGQGKKLLSDFFVLRDGGAEWVELKPAGRTPPPRSGHSMVWDGGDRLLCFGGMTATSTDCSLFAFSISRNEWSSPATSGTAPSPRTHHSAVLLPGHGAMLVFGGCNAAGTFFNDAFLLDLASMRWSRVQPLNTPPPPRYHHSCHVVGSRVVLFGGINPKQAFDSVVLLETSLSSHELSAVADELARMTGAATAAGPGGADSVAAAAAAAPGASSGGSSSGSASSLLARVSGAGGVAAPLVGDLMKLQLRDLLVKRNMEELHVSASQKAVAVEAQLQAERAAKLALQKELLQAKLISSEAEAGAARLKEQAGDAAKALAREQAEHAATSAALSGLRADLDSREQQLAEARQLLDSMSAELGILSSRSHRLQQERDALQAARRAQQAAQRRQAAAAAAADEAPQQQQQQPTSAAAAAAVLPLQSQLQGTGLEARSASACTSPSDEPGAGDSSTSDSQPFVDCVGPSPETAQQDAAAGSSRAAAGLSRGSPDQRSAAGGGHADVLDPSTDEPVPLCAHGQLEAACLLCMCQRFLAATAGCCSHLTPCNRHNSGLVLPCVPGPAAPLPAAAAAAASSEAAQVRQYLAISELARNRLEADNARLQAALGEARAQAAAQATQLRVLQAHPAALTACSIEELTALEGSLETSTKAVRQVVLQRSIAEYQKQASEDSLRCAVCMEAPRRLAFSCGHQTCDACGAAGRISHCPFCRCEITARIRLFE